MTDRLIVRRGYIHFNMIDKIGSCLALNFELGQALLQINFS